MTKKPLDKDEVDMIMEKELKARNFAKSHHRQEFTEARKASFGDGDRYYERLGDAHHALKMNHPKEYGAERKRVLKEHEQPHWKQ